MSRRRRSYYLNNYINSGDFGSGKRLDLFIACVDDQTRVVIAKLRQLGLTDEADNLQERARQAAQAEITLLTEDALKTAQRHVPIDSRELQKQHIRAEYRIDRKGYPEGRVYVDGSDHYGSRRKRPEVASYLAQYLNAPDRRLRRSLENGPHGIYSTTRGWINDAKKDFRARNQAVIRKEV